MLDHHLVFLDLETTGAAAARDRVTEIGLVEVAGGRYVGEWSTLVNPGVAIPPLIQSLTGITDEMVADAPFFAAVAPELARRLEGKVLAAHNARFDFGFLKSEFARAGIEYASPVLCTVKLSRRLYPQHRRHNLDTLMERHGVDCSARHRALGDARVLWDLAQAWSAELGADTLSATIAGLLKAPAVPAGAPDTLFDGLPEAPGVYTLYGENDVALYVGSGVNLRARVMAHFSGAGRRKADTRMAGEVKRVDWTQTAGELGALMLEAQRLSALAPARNRRPQQPAEACAWRWTSASPATAPELVAVNEAPGYDTGNLYGLFRSRAAALAALRELAATHELCLTLIGLEHTKGACYGRQQQRCRGACVGAEPQALHGVRLGQALARLQVARWPYPGPVAVREEHDEHCELHVLDRWCYLGTARTEAEVYEIAGATGAPQFDLDTYRLLARFLKAGAQVVQLAPASASTP